MSTATEKQTTDPLAGYAEHLEGVAEQFFPDLDLTPGLTAIWINGTDAKQTSDAVRRGYKLPKRGEKDIHNQALLTVNEQGYLVYGVSIPALVRTTALQEASDKYITQKQEEFSKPSKAKRTDGKTLFHDATRVTAAPPPST